jgi:glycosyltransferase involved in cell wall biosynthesis
VVVYTHPALFEPALCLASELATRCEVHVVIELHATNRTVANFTDSGTEIPLGRSDAEPLLAQEYPPRMRQIWRDFASFTVVNHGTFSSQDPRSVRISLDLIRWIRGIAPDILHVDDVDVSPRLALALAVSPKPCPVLVAIHDPEPHTGELRWRRKRLTRALAFPKCDGIVLHHSSGVESLRRRHPRLRRPVHVVRLATYDFLGFLDSSGPVELSADPSVLLFGRLTPYKGVEVLYAAARSASQHLEGLRVIVAGRPTSGYTPPEPPRLSRGGVIEPRYEHVPTKALGSLFRGSHIVACPYTDASQSGVVLTAFAFGVPAVVTDVGGMTDYVADGVNGRVVPPGDPAELASTLVALFTEPGALGRLRDGVVERNHTDLSWQRAGRELFAVYESVTASRR